MTPDMPVARLPIAVPTMSEVERHRQRLASLAQEVYESWRQDGDGLDPELGMGGICQDVADALVSGLAEIGVQDAVAIHSSVGENHVFVVASLADALVEVDIPPTVYEVGGGYVWRKRENVVITPEHLVIDRLGRPLTTEEFAGRFLDC